MKPTILHFIPCSDVRPSEPNLHSIDIIGLVTKIRSRQTPPFSLRGQKLMVLIVLCGGQGVGEFTIRIRNDKTGSLATHSSKAHRVQFLGAPDDVIGAVMQVSDCLFPSAGLYWMELVFGTEILAR